MKLMERFWRAPVSAAVPEAAPRLEPQLDDRPVAIGQGEPARASAAVEGLQFSSLNDPALLEYMRAGLSGGSSAPGARSLRNMAILRCCTLITNAIGMLPVNLMLIGDAKETASRHAAHRLLKLKPNTWQTPFEFKGLLQLRLLLKGNAYAQVIWSGARPIALAPITGEVTPRLTGSYRMEYDVTRPDGSTVTLAAKDVLHLRDLSFDGITGMSRVKLASEAIDLAQQAERAASRTFRTGVMASGAIEVANPLSDQAYKRMQESLANNHAGAENAGRWMLLEEGAKASKWASSAADAQHIENRDHQIEEIARAFGVPRPLLMMDDTSWGSGVEQLAIFFVQYTLAPWFTAWEQALARVLLADSELETHQFKFNERALMRGTLKDQADFFAKALGAGGASPWMKQNEVREVSDLPRSDDPVANQLRNPMTQPKTPEKTNEPS